MFKRPTEFFTNSFFHFQNVVESIVNIIRTRQDGACLYVYSKNKVIQAFKNTRSKLHVP